ncbi:uncharacterized protein BcabD6B2_38630 [Babesia caballi]|uniref:Uncharacterized protein n=1 Tax=Babesia caballi TaxID=5871 RepID=A0AAV4LXE7_BABCB|nr:hypothetical protein, conserved [Babesia caballi]
MRYLVGGSTGLVKLVETADRSLQCLSSPADQAIDRSVTCMCWSDGNGDEEGTELAVGFANGGVEIYDYPSMQRVAAFMLPSRCVHLHGLGSHFDNIGSSIYDTRAGIYPSLYPSVKEAALRQTAGRYICCVSECGHCVIVNVDDARQKGDKVVEQDDSMSGEPDRIEVKLFSNGGHADTLTIRGAVAAYKFKGPVYAVAYHSLMTNRIVLGGPDIPPFLFDIFTGTVLWNGRMPHQSLLGLQSHLDVRSICFLEELGPEVIAVSTSDSFIYFYDMGCQRKPVYDLNVCDRRSRCISARRLALHRVREYNTERRKEIRQSVNELYTADSRNIVKLTTRPHRMLQEARYETKDTCDLFASDNVGSIYHLKVVTGDTLVGFLAEKLRKYQPDSTKELGRDEVLNHLIDARKRFGSASANDRPLHCAPRGANQYICELKGCYSIHNGAVTDISCVGHYIISAGLDRFTNVYNVRTRRRLFHLYCNQKQRCVLPLRGQLFQEYELSEFKQLEVPQIGRRTTAGGSTTAADEAGTDDNAETMDVDADDGSEGSLDSWSEHTLDSGSDESDENDSDDSDTDGNLPHDSDTVGSSSENESDQDSDEVDAPGTTKKRPANIPHESQSDGGRDSTDEADDTSDDYEE